MVVPLLVALGTATIGAASPPETGVLFSSPRAVDDTAVRIDYQANVQDGSLIHSPGITLGPGKPLSVHVEGMLRSRDTGPGRDERFELHDAELGWWPWRTEDGPPADLGLGLGATDSVFERWVDGVRTIRTGERTLDVAIRAARSIGWFEPGLGLQWSSRFYKIRRVRLDYLAAGVSLRIRLGPLPADIFGEWLPWIANPDRLPVPWSAGISIGPRRHAVLTVFVTNTYGSAMAATLSAVTDTLWGARVSVEWSFRPTAD